MTHKIKIIHQNTCIAANSSPFSNVLNYCQLLIKMKWKWFIHVKNMQKMIKNNCKNKILTNCQKSGKIRPARDEINIISLKNTHVIE